MHLFSESKKKKKLIQKFGDKFLLTILEKSIQNYINNSKISG